VHFESCVVCRVVVYVDKTEDVSERKYYVYGAGQLCGSCYTRLIDRD